MSARNALRARSWSNSCSRGTDTVDPWGGKAGMHWERRASYKSRTRRPGQSPSNGRVPLVPGIPRKIGPQFFLDPRLLHRRIAQRVSVVRVHDEARRNDVGDSAGETVRFTETQP